MSILTNYPISMPGSKRAIIAQLWPHIPRPESGRIIVPFFGTGADSAFFHEQGLEVVASDVQQMLVWMHNDILLCDSVARIWVADIYDRTKEQYFSIRAQHNAFPSPSVFYLLNRLAFNKLVRHNRRGEFNVPPGDLRENPLAPRESIEAHAKFITAIGGVKCCDFRAACARAEPGDTVYLDPPYYGTFDGYTGRVFPHDELFAQLREFVDRGIAFGCSNSPAASAHVPPECAIREVTRSGIMNSCGSSRGKVREILAVFDPRV